MKVAYIEATGVVTGINRGAGEGELELNITPQELTLGMDSNMYKVVAGTFTPKDAAEIQEVVDARIKAQNAAKAKAEQEAQIEKLKENQTRKDLGLPPVISTADEESVKGHVALLQGDIDNPSADQAYQPPLPPGVTPPSVKSLTVTVTREAGWNDNLGFRVVLNANDPDYTPTNLALAVYSGADCNGYLYTTGAFQLDSETGKYFAVCPPGQEPGDVDIHMGLLYGAAQLSCWTLAAEVSEKKVYAYEEV
jgi:hypothetical protein